MIYAAYELVSPRIVRIAYACAFRTSVPARVSKWSPQVPIFSVPTLRRKVTGLSAEVCILCSSGVSRHLFCPMGGCTGRPRETKTFGREPGRENGRGPPPPPLLLSPETSVNAGTSFVSPSSIRGGKAVDKMVVAVSIVMLVAKQLSTSYDSDSPHFCLVSLIMEKGKAVAINKKG